MTSDRARWSCGQGRLHGSSSAAWGPLTRASDLSAEQPALGDQGFASFGKKSVNLAMPWFPQV